MSRTMKIVAGLGALLVVGLGAAAVLGVVALGVALVVAPMVLAGPATARLEKELAAQLDAEVVFDDVSVDLFGHFPGVGLHVEGLRVTNTAAPFEGVVLAEVGSLDVGVGWVGLLTGGALTVHRLALVEPAFHVVVSEDGVANYDIGPESAPSDASASDGGGSDLTLDLRDVSVAGLDLVYDDCAGGTFVDLRGLDHQLSGTVGSAAIALDTRTTIDALTVKSGGTLLDRTRWDLDVAVEVDNADGTVTFGDNTVSVNALALAFEGTVQPRGDDLAVDLRWSTPSTAFRDVLSLVPTMFTEDFDGVDADGTFSLKGSAKGEYRAEGDHLPALELALTVAGGRFQYPDLPGKVQDVALDLKVTKEEGPADLAVVDMSRFHMAVVNSPASPFDATLKLRNPVTDPFLDATVRGRLDLGGLKKTLPLDGMELGGVLDLDFTVAGRMSDFEAQAVDKVTARGFVRMKDVLYDAEDQPVPIVIERGEVSLAVDRQAVDDLQLRFGRSDLNVDGELVDLLPWSVGDGVLKGAVALKSSRLDLRPFQAEDGEEPPEESDPADEEAAIVPVPPDLDLAIDADLGRVRMDGLDLQKVKGRMAVKDQAVTLDRVRMEMIGGKMTMSGRYAAKDATEADVDLDVSMVSFEIARTVAFFGLLEKAAPILKGAPGRFDTGFAMATKLAGDARPIYETLRSDGDFKAFDLILVPAALAVMGKSLKSGGNDRLDLDGTSAVYSLRGSKLTLSETGVKVGRSEGVLQGTADVDQGTMDMRLDVKVPAKGLGKDVLAAAGVQSRVKELDVRVTMKGPYDDPKVKVTLGDATKAAVEAVVDEVRDDAKDRANDALGKLVDVAREHGDRLVAEAEKAAATIRSEASKAAEKVRSEGRKQAKKVEDGAGKNPVKKAAAKKAAELVREESRKKAKDLEKAADKQADALVAEARAKRDVLVREAEAKATIE